MSETWTKRAPSPLTIKPDKFLSLAVLLIISVALLWSAPAAALGSTPPLYAPLVTPTDLVVLEKVAPEPGTRLTIGQPVKFRAEVKSTLVSRATATLQVYVEMFPKSARGCLGPTSETNGGSYATVNRGTSTLVMTILWPGTAPGPVAWGEGFMSLGASFWINQNQQMKAFGVLQPRWCYPFA